MAMTAAGVMSIVAAAAGATALIAHMVFRLMGVEVRRRHLEVGTAIFLQLGVIYAVFLAFVFGQALTSYVAADNAIDAECAALHGAAILAKALPQTQRDRLLRAERDYVSAVLQTEWPTMRETRNGSTVAAEREITLIDAANSLDTADVRAVRIQTQIVTSLMEAHRSREQRLFEAGQGIPAGLWIMILVYCGCLITLVFFSSLEYAFSHAIVAGMFGGLNALVLLAVFLLQYPFEGPFRLSPETFIQTRAKIGAALTP